MSDPYIDEVRTGYMLLGRRAADDTADGDSQVVSGSSMQGYAPLNSNRITVSLLRKLLVPEEPLGLKDSPENKANVPDADGQKAKEEATAQETADKQFLNSTAVRLDSRGIKKIENLEVLEQLTHLHLQNNLIKRIEELEFVSKLQWLDISRCELNTVSGISHLRQLVHLDLSCNTIEAIDDDLRSIIPHYSLRTLNMYGNPMSLNHGYRNRFTSAFPKLVAFDGTCLCDKPEDAPIAPGVEVYGCDGARCNARVIFGPRFVKHTKDGIEQDYCIACSYQAVSKFKSAEHKLSGHGFVLQANSPEGGSSKEEDDNSYSLEKYHRALGASAREARLAMRKTREQIIMKARARRQAAALNASTRSSSASKSNVNSAGAKK